MASGRTRGRPQGSTTKMSRSSLYDSRGSARIAELERRWEGWRWKTIF